MTLPMQRVMYFLWFLTALALTGCGGDQEPNRYIGGKVTGLLGKGLVLQNNGADNLAVTGNGRFIFKTDVARGEGYAVSVKQQPAGPAQTCTVAKGTGSIVDRDILDVTVTCISNGTLRAVGGTVAGLLGTGLVLQLNGGDEIAVSANGPFAFRSRVVESDAYAITVKAQPGSPAQLCSVAQGTGTVGATDIVNVAVSCVRQLEPTYVVGGTVTGLAGSRLLLQNNGADDLAVDGNGRFAFPTSLQDGAGYAISVKTAPTAPAQYCTVGRGSGSVRGADVADITIECVTQPMFSVGGAVSGLNGSGLVLENHGERIDIAANGRFVFVNTYLSGTAYSVAVKNNPTTPAQSCTVNGAAGTITSMNITDVIVACQDLAIPTYSVGGIVSGLVGTGLVLENASNGELLPVAANGSFVFGQRLLQGGVFNVGVRTQPSMPGQACTVNDGSGIVANDNTVNIAVVCRPPMHYAYVTSLVDTRVYRVDEATGALSATGSAVAQGGILAGIHPAGTRFFYLADVARNAVHAYTIDGATGALAELANSPVASGASQPQAMTATADGRFLYAANRNSNSITAFAIDPSTGMLSPVGAPVSSGLYPLALSATPDGKFLFVANYLDNVFSRYAIDSQTGALTRLADIPTGFSSRFVAIGGRGKFLYATTSANNNRLVHAFTIDGAGALTSVAGSPFTAGNGAQNVETDPTGRYVYVSNETDGTVSSFAIDATSGALVSNGPALAAGGLPEGVAVDPNGKFVYVASQSNRSVFTYRVDGASGTLSAKGPSISQSTPIAITIVNQ